MTKNKKVLIIGIIIIAILISGGIYIGWYLQIGQYRTQEAVVDIDLSDVKMSKSSLVHTISPEQLGIPAPTEDGDGTLLLKELDDKYWGTYQLDEVEGEEKRSEIIREIPEIITKIAEQRNFSLYSDVYSYPETLQSVISGEGWRSLKLGNEIMGLISNVEAALGLKGEFTKSISKTGLRWEVALSLSDIPESAKDFLGGCLVLGKRLVSSNDYDSINYLIGIAIEKRAAEVLAAYYEQKGDKEKSELYAQYLREVKEAKEKFSDKFSINTKLTMYSLGVFSFYRGINIFTTLSNLRSSEEIMGDDKIRNDAEVKDLFKQVAGFGETSLQAEALKYLAMFRAVPRAVLEYSLAEEVLKNYSKSESRWVRNLSEKILNTNPRNLRRELMEIIKEEI